MKKKSKKDHDCRDWFELNCGTEYEFDELGVKFNGMCTKCERTGFEYFEYHSRTFNDDAS